MTQPLYTENGLTAEGFRHYTARAKNMTPDELNFAIKDCHECIENGINENRYKDESSCYFQELQKRDQKKAPKPPIKFYADLEGYPLCERCANERRNSPFEKTRPVKQIPDPK